MSVASFSANAKVANPANLGSKTAKTGSTLAILAGLALAGGKVISVLRPLIRSASIIFHLSIMPGSHE